MRLFIAAGLPGEVVRAVDESVAAPLREYLPGARWTRPDGRHLTLKFLGEVDEDRVDPVAAAVGEVAARYESFEVVLGGIGGFPNLRRPRVVWLGVAEGSEEGAELAADLEEVLEPQGFEPETRPFTWHLTLARFRTPRKVQIPEELKGLRPAPDRFVAAEVVLYHSQLHPRGAQYSALQRFPLAGR